MTVDAGLDGDRCASDQVTLADRSEHDMFQSPLCQCATGIQPTMMARLTRKGPEQLVAPFADAHKQTCNITDGCSRRALPVRIWRRRQSRILGHSVCPAGRYPGQGSS
jgi:hypothetical protein